MEALFTLPDVRAVPEDDFAPQLVWFAEKYRELLGCRYRTFATAFSELLTRSPERRVIVETGCIRQENDYSAGYSTMIFGEFLSKHGGMLWSIDLSEDHLDISRALTKQYMDVLRYVRSDSPAYLRAWKEMHGLEKRIDLLYLDSYDYPIYGSSADQRASQEHCLQELEASLPVLSEQALILIDDADLPGGGKPGLAKQRLAEMGCTCLLDEYQTLWLMNMR